MTGLDGNYRITCHTVMEVLREHKDSVMAVLEAFVYDPLLNWRLMDSKLSGETEPEREVNQSKLYKCKTFRSTKSNVCSSSGRGGLNLQSVHTQ